MLEQPGDLLLMVSGSGNSLNIVEGVFAAKGAGLTPTGLNSVNAGEAVMQVDLLIHGQARIGASGAVKNSHLATNHMTPELLQRFAEVEARS